MENIITLDSSEGEDDDINVIPIVPSPLPLSRPKIRCSKPRQGVEVIHLTTVGPKIEPKVKVDMGYNKINGNTNGITLPTRKVEEITLSSSSDEDETKNESRADSRHQPGPSTLAVAERCSSNRPKNLMNGSGKVESNGEEDTKDVLHDDDVCEVVSDVGTESVCSDAADNIRKLLKTLHGTLKVSERKTLENKIWKKYKKLEKEPKELHDELAKCIDLVNDKLVENPEFNKWMMLQQLFIKFNPEVLRKGERFVISFTSEEQATLEEKKQRRKQRLESMLKEISKIVKRLDREEVNWDSDDENNSAFMQRERLFAKAMKIHNLICKIDKCSRMTGRPIQKAIDLKCTTTYPEVEERVAQFVNRNGYFESPEFFDILEVVNDCNVESQLHLCESDCRQLAKSLHETIIDRRQQLRDLDVPLAFPPECDELADPAETDAELEKKLMENAKMARTIKSVTLEFVVRLIGEIEVWNEPLFEVESGIGEEVADGVSISPPDVQSPVDNQDADISPPTIHVPVEPEIIINNDTTASDIVIQSSSDSSHTENQDPPPAKKPKVDE
ncbi:Death domain-associated protein 6 [Folsomia candida]|uniref:Death domain-associated protein 6 n=1 Tax=Folsomia candida TaxID=158441 RepID=A0A226ET49_FOLCA|nr:Death domain-associated protein 6 [Folsomia candida]